MGLQEERDRSGLTAPWAWTSGIFALLLAWDASGLDVPLARVAVRAGQFVLRDDWLVSGVFHQGMRYAAMAATAWLLLGAWWPTGVLRRLDRPARVQWLASALLAIVFINVLKYHSATSCPWDLAGFGGTRDYISHWAWRVADGGPGRCFPAGHASAGFAFLGGFFVLRRVSSLTASWCLGLSLAAGFLLGVAQQLRGAHFMSHTLWTAWFCWVTAWLVDAAVRCQWGGSEPIPDLK
jgi:membrane-associated PAP2 superfamily phosphatase